MRVAIGLWTVVCGVLGLGWASPAASASILYEVSVPDLSLTFDYTSADFVSTDTLVPATTLTIITSAVPITHVYFDRSCTGMSPFTPSTCDEMAIAFPSGSLFVYFADNAFVTIGSATQITGYSAHLTVSGHPDIAVPEPASLGLLGTGIVALGLGLSRRRSMPGA